MKVVAILFQKFAVGDSRPAEIRKVDENPNNVPIEDPVCDYKYCVKSPIWQYNSSS